MSTLSTAKINTPDAVTDLTLTTGSGSSGSLTVYAANNTMTLSGGNVIVSSANLLVGRTNSTVGSGVKLDVAGGVNAASILINGSSVPVSNGGTGLASATAYAVLAGGTTGTGAFQSVSGVGTTSQFLSSAGAGALPVWQDRIAANTALTTTSGTSIDFGGIPSWAKRITVMFSGVSTSGIANIRIQLGTASGFETTGYLTSGSAFSASGVSTNLYTAGFEFADVGSAASIRSGTIMFFNLTSNTWTACGGYSLSDVARNLLVFGSKALSGTLTSVRITTSNGTDTFDAGTINIMYE